MHLPRFLTWTTHRAGRVHYACDTNHMRSAPLRRPVPAVHAQWTPMRPRLFHHVLHAVLERFGLRWLAAGCTCLFYTPHAARTLPTRVAVAFRTAHLHSGPIARAKFQSVCDAPIIATGDFSTFSAPQNLGGGWPSPGSAVLQLVVVGQALTAVAEKKAAEEAEKVPCSSHWMDGCGLRRTASDTC
jgi:hypothetical protein